MSSYVIVSQSADAALTPELGSRIARALDLQLNRDFAPVWGGSHRVRWATPDSPPAAGELVAHVSDDLPNAGQAIGYHDWSGVPNIYIARNLCLSLSDGDVSLSQCLSHELLETEADRACNRWADDGTGRMFALEVCDSVERGWYLIDGIAVSDFLLPSFFEPGALPPYGFLQRSGGAGAAAPFTTGFGGYQLARSADPTIVQVFGMISVQRRAKKCHPTSRSYRRGLRLSP